MRRVDPRSIRFGVFVPQGWRRELVNIANPIQRVATFETDLRTADDIETMLAGQTGTLPDGGGGARRPGRDLGRAALTEVARLGADRGLWKLVSRIVPENHASRALCQCLGFREVGVCAPHAKLDGAWKDCVIVEKLIGEAI